MFRLRAVSLLFLLVATQCASAASALQRTYYENLALIRTRELLYQTVPQWALGVNLIAAVTLYFVWRSQRNVPHFNWLLGACLSGNVINLTTLFPNFLHPLLVDLLLSAWLYCLLRILFTHPTEALQRWLTTFSAGLLVGLGFARELGGSNAHALLIALAFSVLTLVAATRLFLNLRDKRTPKISLLFGVFLLGLTAVIDSISYLLDGHLDTHPQQLFLLNPFAQMIAVILALYFLVTRHANNQLELSELNANLDARVREAEHELEDRYRLLKQDAVDTAALRERRSIYQSIHEDLSDKLLQLIYRAPAPETADLARAALAELRDTQKLDPEQHKEVPHILADALAEVQTRCEQAGLQLAWQVSPQLETLKLNARQESALTRTLREAISNLLKHAHAKHVEICFWLDDSSQKELQYTVSDDGVGIDPARPKGRGLINMRQRLEELGGQVGISTANIGGTCLHFSLPFSSEHS